jgi:hypothetical protein
MSGADESAGNDRSALVYYWDLLRLWCSGKMDSDDALKKDHLLAKRMFYCGCLALPWLWIVNVLYFRILVYGPLPWWDTEANEAHSDSASNSTHQFQESQSTFRTVADVENNQAAADPQSPLEKEELRKWVHRSALGAVSVTSLFIAWTLIFQLNKSSFSDGWFVMSPDDEVISGW